MTNSVILLRAVETTAPRSNLLDFAEDEASNSPTTAAGSDMIFAAVRVPNDVSVFYT